jgi:hypothetical protein
MWKEMRLPMHVIGWRGIVLYGLVFMILFLYTNALLFVSIHEPNFGEEAFSARGPYYWRVMGRFLEQNLLRSTLPAWILTLKMQERLYAELVYYPLLGAILWFGYGCMIAWGRRTKRVMLIVVMLAALWVGFYFVAKVGEIPTLF